METGRLSKVAVLLQEVANWAIAQEDVVGVVLVGSFASGRAGPGSDVDLVIISKASQILLEDSSWTQLFGSSKRVSWEDWGKVRSLRVRYERGLEVEFGIAGADWIASPIDEGTNEVLRSGAALVYDREGAVAKTLRDNDIDYWRIPSGGEAW